MSVPASRRSFLRNTLGAAGAFCLQGLPALAARPPVVPLFAHLWVYASRFPPEWDATPVLDEAFSEIKAAGFAGIELMEVNLRQDDAVRRLRGLVQTHGLPISGTSYSANTWDRERHDAILQDVVLVTGRLQQLGGTTFGISVGDAGRRKTEAELDVQAATLSEILNICSKRGITPNLHNHTYELREGMYDLRQTLLQVPDLKLGPDINWLVRGGVNPLTFIQEFGHRMAYLHLRDQGATGKWTEALGEGVTDFKAIAAALQQVSFAGAAAVELAYDAPQVQPTAANWSRSRKYVREVFGW